MSLHGSPFFIESFAKDLGERILDHEVSDIFSTSKEDIYFRFSDVILKCSFYNGELFFSYLDRSEAPSKGRLAQFKSAIGHVVASVETYPLERGFVILLSEDKWLIFKLFGNRANVIGGSGSEVEWTFRNNLQKDLVFTPDSLRRSDQDKSQIEFGPKEEMSRKYPFMRAGFLDQIFQEPGTSEAKFVEFKSKIKNPVWYWNPCRDFTGIYQGIQLLGSPVDKNKTGRIGSWISEFTRDWLGWHRFVSKKQDLIRNLEKEMRQRQERAQTLTSALSRYEGHSKYREFADLIMANLWQISEGQKEVALKTFDGKREVTIPLKKDLSAQKNAERFYRKAKNEHLEVERLEKEREGIAKQVLQLEEWLQEAQNAKFSRDLPRVNSISEKSKEEENLPYHIIRIQGFEIWVGKNAKGNDIILKKAGKNDTWLHVRDVAGSHVVIRNPNQVNIPDHILEEAASLAAGKSKRKSEGLVAVIYTLRKYVRKFKGAKPGQVKVDREEVVLVPPKEV